MGYVSSVLGSGIPIIWHSLCYFKINILVFFVRRSKAMTISMPRPVVTRHISSKILIISPRIFFPMSEGSPTSSTSRCQMISSVALLNSALSMEWRKMLQVTKLRKLVRAKYRFFGRAWSETGRITSLQNWTRDLRMKCWQNWKEVD